jgi:hypothetical protein
LFFVHRAFSQAIAALFWSSFSLPSSAIDPLKAVSHYKLLGAICFLQNDSRIFPSLVLLSASHPFRFAAKGFEAGNATHCIA